MRRVIAQLVAFAALAERSALRSAPVRFVVLWLLSRAAAIAEDFVLDATGMPAAAIPSAPAGNAPGDALLVAARFRALAAALCVLLVVPCHGRRRMARHILHVPRALLPSAAIAGASAAHDTS